MRVPFVTDAYRGDVPINWFPAKDDEKGVIMFGTPGQRAWCDLGGSITSTRGMHVMGDYLYAVGVQGNTSLAYKISKTAVVTLLGTILSTDGFVSIDDNGLQVRFCDGAWSYVYTLATGIFAQVTDADFPGSGMVTYLDGYGIYIKPNTNMWGWSALYNYMAYDAADYASKEGKPDKLVGIFADHRELWLFGELSTEIWYNAGTSPNPFARSSPGLIERGCASPGSIAAVDNSIYWLGDTRQVFRTEGYKPTLLSTRKMEREVSGYSMVSDAVAFAYADQGHTFYQITFPTADVTWVYDAATLTWHKRKSYPAGRHRASCYAFFDNKHLVGAYDRGIICELDMSVYKDDEDNIVRTLYSNEMRNEGKRIFFKALQIEFDEGVGLQDGTDPQAMLSWSGDGGNTWSNEAWTTVSAGKIGEYGKRSIWRKMGAAFSRIFKLTVSDPVKWVILGVNWR